MTWFIASTIPGLDRGVEEELTERKIGCYLPRQRAFGRNRRDKTRVIVKRPLLPGYLFVELDFPRQSFAEVLQAHPGVRGFLHPAGREHPYELPLGFVEEWRAREAAGEFDLVRQDPVENLQPGQRVRVKGGQFQGYFADVSRAKTGEQRVAILISIFGRQSPMEIARDQLEVAKEGAPAPRRATAGRQPHRLTRTDTDPVGQRSFGSMAPEDAT